MLHTSVSNYYNNIININYDSGFLCTYKLHTDDDDRNLCYQLQLLQALNIDSYDSIILTSNIDKIGLFLQNNTELEAILLLLKEKYKDTNIAYMIDEHNSSTLFQLLFSYDYFDIFHKCLCKYINDKKDDKKHDKKDDKKDDKKQNGEHGLTMSYLDVLKSAITL